MKKYQGRGVCGGIAIGRIYCIWESEEEIIKYQVTDPQREQERFLSACRIACDEISGLLSSEGGQIGEKERAIFAAHQMLLQDVTFQSSVEAVIAQEDVNAEYAVHVTGERFARMFGQMEDEYMRERAADMKDVTARLLTVMAGKSKDRLSLEEPVIILTRDLSPGETLQLDKEKVLAFVTLRGSPNSHTAILAKALGIPGIVGLRLPGEETLSALDGTMAAVDGWTGCLYAEPEGDEFANLQQLQKQDRERRALLKPLKGKETVTREGQKVRLYANVSDGRELGRVLDNDAEGIGLFRSEFLYLGREDLPTEEEQYEAYRTVMKAMQGRPVIIRTLDIGADKQATSLSLGKEENPAMGLRAIRICLTRPEIFRTQLRALYRAAAEADGNLAIMYPMITSVEEVRQILTIARDVRRELTEEGIPWGEASQGIMIETPAAVMISDLLAREVDFFSIGTNDLTQYACALDRQNSALEDFYDAHHIGVLRMIAQTVKNAHKAGIWCGICGELGADTTLMDFFLALGVDELSVSPGLVLPVRKAIRETSLKDRREQILQERLQIQQK